MNRRERTKGNEIIIESRQTYSSRCRLCTLCGEHRRPLCRAARVCTAHRIDIGVKNPIDPFDLTAILGNLLRNAAEALEQLSPDMPHILRLALVHHADNLFLTVDNSFNGDLCYDAEGALLSSKRSYRERGVGMESIYVSLAHYHGMMEFTAEDGLFEVSIALTTTTMRTDNEEVPDAS